MFSLPRFATAGFRCENFTSAQFVLAASRACVSGNAVLGNRLKEALAVQVLRVIRYLAENHSTLRRCFVVDNMILHCLSRSIIAVYVSVGFADAFITPNEEITTVVQALVTLANRTQTTNEVRVALKSFQLTVDEKNKNTHSNCNAPSVRLLCRSICTAASTRATPYVF